MRQNESSPSRALLGLAVACVLGAGMVTSLPVMAQEADESSQAEQRGGLPPLDKVIKDMQKISAEDGALFTLYRFDPNDPAKDPTKLIAVIPKGLLGKDLLMATSMSRGPLMGYPAGSDLVRWEVSGNTLKLMAPDVLQKETAGKVVTDAVTNTYTPRFLAVLPIISRTPAGDPVVDMGIMFKQMAAGMRGMGGNPRPDLIRFQKVKAFPDNVLVDLDIALLQGDGSGSNVGVGISFRRLPDLARHGYKPRIADERVGYFTTVRQDWNTPYTEKENIVRYINRWNVQKLDPSLEMSPPDKPIVFIIEKTVPLQWRRYVAEGILEWNKAYEAIGISNAIIVQQQTDDNEFANVDPEDARYNFFRWIVTGRGFAMGPSRPDPRTGEILDADIIFDDSMLRFQVEDFAVMGPKAIAAQYGPEMIEFLEKNPAFLPAGMDVSEVKALATEMRMYATLATGDTELLMDEHAAASMPHSSQFRRRAPISHPTACTYAQGMRQQMMFTQLGMIAQAKATGMKIPEKLIGGLIRDVTMHEVGHTLGLRHNFEASTWLSTEEIKQRRDNTDEPTFASVMDYNATLYFPGDKLDTLRHITTPTVGPYDMWAIEYGYRTPGKEDGGEEAMLAKIAARNNEPGLAYATDEDVMGASSPDPRANRWDMGSDPIEWAKQRTALADELMANLKEWAIEDDEPTHFLRGIFGQLMFERMRNGQYVARVIGGQHFDRNRPGDPDAKPPLVLVEPAKQREALAFLGETIFNDDYIKVDPELLNKLVAARNWDEFGRPSPRIDYPVHSMMLRLQNFTLLQLVNPQTLQRVYDAELKTAADDKFTSAELLKSTRKLVFGEKIDASKSIASTRRNLQAQYVEAMLANAQMSSLDRDLSNQVRFLLRGLSNEIGKQIEGKSDGDFATLAHLTEIKSKIDRTLDAPEISGVGAGPITIIMGESAQ